MPKKRAGNELSQIRQIAQGEGARQKSRPRHSQQYQLHAPVRPTDGTAENPPAGHPLLKKRKR